MALLLKKIKDTYDFLSYDLADVRTRDMLFPTAFQMITILFLYTYFIQSLGPRLMKNIKPFKLRTVIFYYNIFQIFICAYIIYLFFSSVSLTEYNYWCQPVDMTENLYSRTMINGIWWYTTVKIIDLLDTVFFILRKKDRQISFLHVFHHTGMPILSYAGLKYYPNGHSTSIGPINCFVHMVMYTYYLIASLGPKYHKYLWWKKYVTILQMVQFVLIFIHNAVALSDRTCSYPKWISAVLCSQSILFIYMFGSFFYENYVKKPQTIASAKKFIVDKKEVPVHEKSKVQ